MAIRLSKISFCRSSCCRRFFKLNYCNCNIIFKIPRGVFYYRVVKSLSGVTQFWRHPLAGVESRGDAFFISGVDMNEKRFNDLLKVFGVALLVMSFIETKNTSAGKTVLPPVNQSCNFCVISGTLAVAIVWRPGPNVSRAVPSRKKTTRCASRTITCEPIR